MVSALIALAKITLGRIAGKNAVPDSELSERLVGDARVRPLVHFYQSDDRGVVDPESRAGTGRQQVAAIADSRLFVGASPAPSIIAAWLGSSIQLSFR